MRWRSRNLVVRVCALSLLLFLFSDALHVEIAWGDEEPAGSEIQKDENSLGNCVFDPPYRHPLRKFFCSLVKNSILVSGIALVLFGGWRLVTRGKKQEVTSDQHPTKLLSTRATLFLLVALALLLVLIITIAVDIAYGLCLCL